MSVLIERALAFRKMVEEAVQYLPDEKIQDYTDLFPEWSGAGAEYEKNKKVRFKGEVYRIIQSHVSQPDRNPVIASSLFAKVLTEPGKILPWEQPESTNAYETGDKVTHKDSTWVSVCEPNVWEPGVYGWEKVEE